MTQGVCYEVMTFLQNFSPSSGLANQNSFLKGGGIG